MSYKNKRILTVNCCCFSLHAEWDHCDIFREVPKKKLKSRTSSGVGGQMTNWTRCISLFKHHNPITKAEEFLPQTKHHDLSTTKNKTNQPKKAAHPTQSMKWQFSVPVRFNSNCSEIQFYFECSFMLILIKRLYVLLLLIMLSSNVKMTSGQWPSPSSVLWKHG